VALRYQAITTAEGLRFLRLCYTFVETQWQRLPREALPDKGFELHFRRSCVTTLNGWQISQEWELGLGSNLATASGVRHEIDLVARHPNVLVIAELKNKPGWQLGKNDVIIFFAKILDYLAHNPTLLLGEVLPVFISSCAFETATLATCLGLGIHPVAPGLRPLPVLADSLERIESAIEGGSVLPKKATGQWADACAGLNRLELGLSDTWLSARCGYVSNQVMNLRATLDAESYEMDRQLRQVNGDCSGVLEAIRLQQAAG
jgi:hypothetical protein